MRLILISICTLFTFLALSAEEALDLAEKSVGKFPDDTQFSIAVVEGDETRYFGLLKTNDSIGHIENKDSVFEIGSISKVFTSLLLSYGVEKGIFTLDTPLSEIYPFELAEGIGKIKLIELSNHTSGLPSMPTDFPMYIREMDNPYKYYDSTALIKYLSSTSVSLGEKKYSYSNLGAGLLAFAISKKLDTDYETLLQEWIARPIGMNNTSINRSGLEERLVKGQNPQGQETANWDLGALEGAGSILSSTEDLSSFAKAQYQNPPAFMALAQRETSSIREDLSIGLGWHIKKELDSGKEYIWHNGGTGGYSSMMIIDLEAKKAVIILTNVSAFHPKRDEIDKLAIDILDSLNK